MCYEKCRLSNKWISEIKIKIEIEIKIWKKEKIELKEITSV